MADGGRSDSHQKRHRERGGAPTAEKDRAETEGSSGAKRTMSAKRREALRMKFKLLEIMLSAPGANTEGSPPEKVHTDDSGGGGGGAEAEDTVEKTAGDGRHAGERSSHDVALIEDASDVLAADANADAKPSDGAKPPTVGDFPSQQTLLLRQSDSQRLNSEKMSTPLIMTSRRSQGKTHDEGDFTDDGARRGTSIGGRRNREMAGAKTNSNFTSLEEAINLNARHAAQHTAVGAEQIPDEKLAPQCHGLRVEQAPDPPENHSARQMQDDAEQGRLADEKGLPNHKPCWWWMSLLQPGATAGGICTPDTVYMEEQTVRSAQPATRNPDNTRTRDAPPVSDNVGKFHDLSPALPSSHGGASTRTTAVVTASSAKGNNGRQRGRLMWIHTEPTTRIDIDNNTEDAPLRSQFTGRDVGARRGGLLDGDDTDGAGGGPGDVSLPLRRAGNEFAATIERPSPKRKAEGGVFDGSVRQKLQRPQTTEASSRTTTTAGCLQTKLQTIAIHGEDQLKRAARGICDCGRRLSRVGLYDTASARDDAVGNGGHGDSPRRILRSKDVVQPGNKLPLAILKIWGPHGGETESRKISRTDGGRGGSKGEGNRTRPRPRVTVVRFLGSDSWYFLGMPMRAAPHNLSLLLLVRSCSRSHGSPLCANLYRRLEVMPV